MCCKQCNVGDMTQMARTYVLQLSTYKLVHRVVSVTAAVAVAFVVILFYFNSFAPGKCKVDKLIVVQRMACGCKGELKLIAIFDVTRKSAFCASFHF